MTSRQFRKPEIAFGFRSSLHSAHEKILEVRRELHAATIEIANDNLGLAEMSKLLFFGAPRQLSATLGGIHPALPKGTIHQSTTDGLRSIIEHLDLGKPQDCKRLSTATPEGSFAILGGPAANLHARLIMGCGGLSPLFGVQLPVTFDCPSISPLDPNDEPWSVLIDGRKSQAECLVITSLPLAHGSDRITIFAGLRGAGTRAIKLLLRDPQLIEKLYRDTRRLLGWQAVIEVRAKDMNFPDGIGVYRVLEIANIDFGNVNALVPDDLLLSESEVAQLIQLLPPNHQIDFSDDTAIGVTNLSERRLDKMLAHGNILPGKNPAFDTSRNRFGRLLRPPERGSVSKPPFLEANMGHRFNNAVESEKSQQSPRRRGRPPKKGVTLTRRLQIMMSERDIEMIQDIQEATRAASMGEVIRNAIEKEFEGLSTSKPKRKLK